MTTRQRSRASCRHSTDSMGECRLSLVEAAGLYGRSPGGSPPRGWPSPSATVRGRRRLSSPQPRMHLGAALREHPIRTLSGLYCVLSFVGLLILGGLDNKGLTVHNGHYYVIHAHGILMPISRAEYQRQAAYPLWMFSAATLFFATLVLGLAVPRSLWASRRIMRLADRYM